jgi:hypothetical protein
LTIADDASGDRIERPGRDGSPEKAVDHENIQRSRLRCDSRKWLLSKLLPDGFGERTTTAVTGPNGGAIKTENASSGGYDYLKHLSTENKFALREILLRASAAKNESDEGGDDADAD